MEPTPPPPLPPRPLLDHAALRRAEYEPRTVEHLDGRTYALLAPIRLQRDAQLLPCVDLTGERYHVRPNAYPETCYVAVGEGPYASVYGADGWDFQLPIQDLALQIVPVPRRVTVGLQIRQIGEEPAWEMPPSLDQATPDDPDA